MAEATDRQAEILDWDSAFWGFRTARVSGDTLTSDRVRQIDDWCRRDGVRCLYFLARSDDSTTTHLAETNGFRFVDVRLTLERLCHSLPTVGSSLPGGQAIIRHARPDDLAALQRIARESHRDSRFYYDPGFPRPLCDHLYETWIKVDLSGTANQVMVAEADGIPVGYITCRLAGDTREGRISLVGVQRQAQGKGVGKALVDCALGWFSTQRAATVLVTTQGRNVVAQRIYQRRGFVTRSVEIWYHKWYPTGAGL